MLSTMNQISPLTEWTRRITKNNNIGVLNTELPELQDQDQSSKWYRLFDKNKPAGEANVRNDGLYGEHGVKSDDVFKKE